MSVLIHGMEMPESGHRIIRSEEEYPKVLDWLKQEVE